MGSCSGEPGLAAPASRRAARLPMAVLSAASAPSPAKGTWLVQEDVSVFGAEGGAGSSGQPAVCGPRVTSPRYCAVALPCTLGWGR